MQSTLASTYNQAWLRTYQNADGTYANWNGLDQYNKNPYWDLYKNKNTSAKDVFRFTGKAIWNIAEGLKLQGTVGTDINNMTFDDFVAKTTPGQAAGSLTNQVFHNRTLNAELLMLADLEKQGMIINTVSDDARAEMAKAAQPAAIKLIAQDIGQDAVDEYLANVEEILAQIAKY